jgi:methylenetetrahydrofolate reductase (NADPH)
MSACPKTMAHGPCGGVRTDGACEVPGLRCGLVEEAITDPIFDLARPALGDGALELLALAARRPIVVADLPAAPLDADAQRASAAAVAGCVDAALLGDSPWARVQLPPTVRASIVASEGVRPWATLSCRDRNRVALEGELAGLSATGAPAVHCVTGDHPILGHRPDAEPVFDLDSPRLAALAGRTDLLVSVAESPQAPPVARRPARAASKARAGAHVCFINHTASPEDVGAFIAAANDEGATLAFLACVPIATSPAALERIARFAGGTLPAATVAALDERDRVGAAIRAAVAHAEALIAVDGVSGVDLAAVAPPGEELEVAAALALAAEALGGGS